VLGQPALLSGHHRRNAQRKALFPQKGVAAVTGAIGPDRLFFREMGNVLSLDRGAGPLAAVGFPFGQRFAHGVQAGNEHAVFAQHVQDLLAHTGHDVHIHDDVRRIGNFNANPGDGGSHRPHAERDHVHRAAFHAAVVKAFHRFLQFIRIDPVVGGARFIPGLRRDIGAVFHTRHVGRIGSEQEAIWTLFPVQGRGQARIDHNSDHGIIFIPGAVAPVNFFRFTHFGHVIYPLDELLVFGHTAVVHSTSPLSLFSKPCFHKPAFVFQAKPPSYGK